MRYLWQEPLERVNDELVAFLGEEPHTPLVEALLETLRGLGCIEARSARSAAPAIGRSRRAPVGLRSPAS